MTVQSYTSGTAIATRMASDGQTLPTGGSAICTSIASEVNERLESYVGRPIGPAGTAIRTYDGDGTTEMWIPEGLTGITTLRIRDATNGTWFTMLTGEYVVRPQSHSRPTGWPAFYIKLTDVATTQTRFAAGYDTVEVTPDSSGFGWAAIPTELSSLATIWGVRLYQNRQGGEAGQIGSNEFGASVFAVLTDDDWEVLNRYRFAVTPTYIGGGQ
jgi:hypothetical protein